jgi:2-dehydropantoate 2-reductase
MSTFPGRIGIIGSGALGALYGAKLFKAGHDVHFLLRSDYEAVRANGLKILSCDGDFEIRPPVYPTPADMGPCDLLVIGLKTTSNDALPALLGPVVTPRTTILTLQNGLGNEDRIAAVLGGLGIPDPPSRILGGVAFLCSARLGPGVINHTDHGRIRMAEYRGPVSERAAAIRDLFKGAGVACTAIDSLAQARWEKLVWNVPFNGLGVAAGHADSASVLRDDELTRTARELMREVIAGARCEGVTIDPVFEQKMIDATPSMQTYKSSMQLDYELGRPLEVEAILGEPVRRARAAGIPVPKMEMLYAIVRRLDALSR